MPDLNDYGSLESFPDALNSSVTTFEQLAAHGEVVKCFPEFPTGEDLTLNRVKHVNYLSKGLYRLSGGFGALDAR